MSLSIVSRCAVTESTAARSAFCCVRMWVCVYVCGCVFMCVRVRVRVCVCVCVEKKHVLVNYDLIIMFPIKQSALPLNQPFGSGER